MTNFLFVLGRDPDLSFIEIRSYFLTHKIPYNLLSKNNLVLVIDSDFDARNLINILGGTIKIAKQIDLRNEGFGLFKFKNVYYSFTNYDGEGSEEIFDFLKQKFKHERMKLLFVNPGNGTYGIDPSKFYKKKMFENGFEIFKFKGIVYKTVAVSDTLGIEKRDIGRPFQEPLEAISIR